MKNQKRHSRKLLSILLVLCMALTIVPITAFAAGVNYIDTANYEPEDTDDPEWRAIYEKRCKEAGSSDGDRGRMFCCL